MRWNWAVGLSMLAMPAHASEPASAPLPGTTLHIVATGVTKTRPDRILVRVPIQENGRSATEARQAAQAKLDKLKASLSAIGITMPNVITRTANPFGFVGNEQYGDEAGGSVLHVASQSTPRTANSLVEIALADPAQVKKVNDILDDLNLTILGAPQPSLIDDRAAKHGAVSDAIRKARAEAADYADALGFSVGSITHVSNDCGSGDADYKAMISGWANMFSGRDDSMVETTASVCVDFMLEKR